MGNGKNRSQKIRNHKMAIFSKVLTLNKLHMLEKINGNLSDASQTDYFNIGMPIENPPLLRGSIVIEMNISFLTDNIDSFEAGSPVDTGGIKFGFLDPKHDKELFLQMLHCDYTKFHKLTKELFELPLNSLNKLVTHNACPSFKPILEKHFTNSVIEFMYNEKNPHAWLFEFSLRKEYKLTEKHINKIHVPNTYLSNSTIKNIKYKLRNKVITYNPKYGIEHRGR